MTNYDTLKEYETHNTPLPSYDELQLMNEAVNQALAANAKLVKKNTKIKELLKECRLSINGYPPYESGSEILKLTYRIDEVLGEKNNGN